MVTVTDPRQGKLKLWLYDLNRGTSSPFTFGEGNDQYPAWSFPEVVSRFKRFRSARNSAAL